MAELSNLSVNIRGLNGPIKRAKFLDYLRRKNIDVALIQESHLRKRDVNRLQNKYFKVAASYSDDTKTKGSIVLLSWKCALTVDKSMKTYQAGYLIYVLHITLSTFSLLAIFSVNITFSSIAMQMTPSSTYPLNLPHPSLPPLYQIVFRKSDPGSP